MKAFVVVLDATTYKDVPCRRIYGGENYMTTSLCNASGCSNPPTLNDNSYHCRERDD